MITFRMEFWCHGILLIYSGITFCESKRSFKEIRDFENMISNEGMLQEFTLKNDNCWRLCHSHNLCKSFFSNRLKKECRLMSGIINGTASLVTEIGWAYYSEVNGCPTSKGYIYNETANLCFKLTDIKVIDDDAEDVCKVDGARVIQITNIQQQTAVAEYLNGIGLIHHPGIDGRINSDSTSWEDSAYFRDGRKMEFFRWGPDGEPDKPCIKLDSSINYSWTGSLCTKLRLHICEMVL